MPTRPPALPRWPLLVVHAGGWLPAANIAGTFWTQGWPVNPIQDLTFGTGLPALIFLMLTLAVTPVITLTGWSWLAPARRWLGLYAAAYAAAHVFIFVVVDYGLDLGLIWDAVIEKRYILAGLGAWLILLPLALTSTRGWQKRLGRDWKRLHRGVYAAALLVVLHFVWLVKADVREPLAYGAGVALLLLARLPAVRAWLAGLRRRGAGGRGRPVEPPPAAE